MQGSYDKIIITIVPSYTRKNITHLLPLASILVLWTRNNTDGNKLVIFFSIASVASYCGDSYIIVYEYQLLLSIASIASYCGDSYIIVYEYQLLLSIASIVSYCGDSYIIVYEYQLLLSIASIASYYGDSYIIVYEYQLLLTVASCPHKVCFFTYALLCFTITCTHTHSFNC